MRVEEIVGANMRQARERAGMSQAELGEAMAEHLGDQWRRRQPVSTAETGKRAFTAAELLTIASVLSIPVNALFVPPMGDRFIEVGGDGLKPVDDLGGAMLRSVGRLKLKSRMWDALADLRDAEANQIELINTLLEAVRPTDAAIDTLSDGLKEVFARFDAEPDDDLGGGDDDR